jgi:O-antigen/teichoic acid export membrane protein
MSGVIIKEFVNKYYKYLINSGFYFGGSLIQLVFAFFSQPIYARYLSAADFGILGYYGSIQGFFTPIFLFGMTQYYLMNYFRQKDEENKSLLFNILAYLSVAGVVVSLLGFAGLAIAFKNISISVPFMPFSLLIFFILYFNVFTSFLLINLRIRKKALSFFLFSSIPPAMNVAFGLFYVINYKMGAEGKLLGQVTTNIIIGLLSLYLLRRYLILKINFQVIKKSFAYILPIIGAGYAYYPISSIDRIYLERLNNLPELGYYSLGLTASNFINMAGLALFMAFEPDVYRLVIEKDKRKLIQFGGVFLMIVALMVLSFILISPYLMAFLTSGKYTRAYKYANINAIGVFLMLLFGFMNAIIIALKKTQYALYTNLIGGGAALFVYYFMIKWFSFSGANYAFIIVAAILAGSSFLFIRNFFYGRI